MTDSNDGASPGPVRSERSGGVTVAAPPGSLHAPRIDAAPPQPGDPPPADEEKVMSLVEHLTELRRRVVVGAVAFLVGSLIGFAVSEPVIALLKRPVPGPLFYTELGGAFFLRMKLGLMIGAALASPVLLYQLWAFVSPGLTPRERRALRPWVPLSIVLLIIGIGVAYAILPYTTSFLLSFGIPGVVEELITAEKYFGFVTTMFLAFGLVMQFPIVLVLLAKAGIVSADRLRRSRRYVLVGIVVASVVITPGGDPVSPIIMTLVMYPIYELTLRLIGDGRARDGVDG